ncbi:MAG: hypothetical protein M3410_02785 [Acidobacteriota bacterium]|nr:hypothetical protein [Acidobacteriota bacterium]
MYRYSIRLSVAVLAFVVGLTLSVVVRTVTPLPTAVSLSKSATGWQDLVSSPAMSIVSRPDEPLKLLYRSTSVDALDGNRRRVHFVVQNMSNRNITAYAIRCAKWMSGVKNAISVEANSRKEVFHLGETRPFVVDCDADEMLELKVDSVEFQDGSRWTSNS